MSDSLKKEVPTTFEKEIPITQVDFTGVYSTAKIASMQKNAPNFGVNILVLAEEGQRYDHRYRDEKGDQIRTYTGTVPQGHSYIRISGTNDRQKADMNAFWNAFHAEEKAKQPPSNPPKI